MNFKEAFSIVEANERTLSSILENRQIIEEFKQKLIDPSQKDESLLKIKKRLFDTGALDILSEALDYLPEGEVFIQDSPDVKLITFRHGPIQKFIDLDIAVYVNLNTMGINVGRYFFSDRARDYTKHIHGLDFGVSLDQKEWQDPGRVAAAIADAVWKAGGKTPKASSLPKKLQ